MELGPIGILFGIGIHNFNEIVLMVSIQRVELGCHGVCGINKVEFLQKSKEDIQIDPIMRQIGLPNEVELCVVLLVRRKQNMHCVATQPLLEGVLMFLCDEFVALVPLVLMGFLKKG